MKKYLLHASILCSFLMGNNAFATLYSFNNTTPVATLNSKLSTALPGDTITLADGVYANYGAINFDNPNGSASSKWIVLRAATSGGVIFSGYTLIQFGGYKISIEGFTFANGSANGSSVIKYAYNTSAFYSRVSNVTIDNYNSSTKNIWIRLYGTNNRLDHCTFINKNNESPVVAVVYDNIVSHVGTPTYHRIDSNYFNAMSYQGGNEGECIRIGDSYSSRTKGYNIVEYNLFQNITAQEPEIISNKSDYNIYRYNTFRNSKGGLTLRFGRYCKAYGNYFFVNTSQVACYGIRIFDRGHAVYNNYMEGLNGNNNNLKGYRSPLSLCNGELDPESNIDDSIAGFPNSAAHFQADSCIVVFNTIVNAKGGAGIVIGYTDYGEMTYPQKHSVVNYNIVKMINGFSVYVDTTASINTNIAFTAKGNLYSNSYPALPAAISGFKGYSNTTYPYPTARDADSLLTAPVIVRDSCIRDEVIQPGSSIFGNLTYQMLLENLDVSLKTRGSFYDVGSDEINATGDALNTPLQPNQVGARAYSAPLPVKLLQFKVIATNKANTLNWLVANEVNFKHYEVEYSADGTLFYNIGNVLPNQKLSYSFTHNNSLTLTSYYRLKLVDKNGTFSYSNIISVGNATTSFIKVYPNPASQFINVVLSPIKNATSIKLVDASGKVLINIPIADASQNTFQIPLNTVALGIYMVQIVTKENEVINQKLIINK